jgi:hypothetical protein
MVLVGAPAAEFRTVVWRNRGSRRRVTVKLRNALDESKERLLFQRIELREEAHLRQS